MLEVVCEECGTTFQIASYRRKTARYCSRECMGRAYAQKAPFYTPVSNRETVSCKHCGQTFTREAARASHHRGIYCSKECQYKAIAERPSHAKRSFVCISCGTSFTRYRSQVQGKPGTGKYCSRACRDKHRIGDKHPQYLGGKGHKYGPNWQAQKRKAKHRDKHTCRHCGIDQPCCKTKHRQGLQVHHMRPFRLFTSYLLANSLVNLCTLCPECHRIADAAFQRLEREVQAFQVAG